MLAHVLPMPFGREGFLVYRERRKGMVISTLRLVMAVAMACAGGTVIIRSIRTSSVFPLRPSLVIPLPGKNNDDQYELGQIQRGYERQIRQAKRECSTLDAAMASADSDELVAQLKADFSRASVKLKAREAKLKTFVREHNLQRDTLREYSAGWSRSTSSKTVWANRKSKATGK